MQVDRSIEMVWHVDERSKSAEKSMGFGRALSDHIRDSADFIDITLLTEPNLLSLIHSSL
jgi:hypothetical protein